MIKHVDDCLGDEEYICFLCKKKFKTAATLKHHIKSIKDNLHEQYRKKLEKLKTTYAAVDTMEELQCLGCGNDLYCYNCGNSKCIREEKNIYKTNYKRLNKKTTESANPNSAMHLINEFYEQRGNNNFAPVTCEVRKIRSYIKKYSADIVRQALQLLISRGDVDLTYFGEKIIHETIQYLHVKDLLTVKNSVPYLIKQYYIKLNLFMPIYNIVQDFKTVEQITFAHKLTDDQVKFAIQYMIDYKLIPFSSINRYMTKILVVYKQNTKVDEDYSQSIIKKLQNVSITYDEIVNIYGDQAAFLNYIKNILQSKQYNQQFSAIEWLYKLNVPVTKDIYFLAKENVMNYNEKLYHFGNDDEINKFKKWLKDYKCKYEKA